MARRQIQGTHLDYDTDKIDMEIVARISDEEPYQFDITLVVRDLVDGKMYWVHDSGRSCPSPFEDYHHTDQLEPLPQRLNALERWLHDSCYNKVDALDFLQSSSSHCRRMSVSGSSAVCMTWASK